MMECYKCNSPSSVILRKKDHYCKDCFLSSANHKFRACIGKNKILSKNAKVLLCLSGGPGSTVLLDLVHHGISLDIHKKLRVNPYILHVTGVSDNSIDNLVQMQCQTYNFDVYFIPISDYLQEHSKLPNVNCVQVEKSEKHDEFETILKSMPTSTCNDFLSKVKRSLFIKYAKLLECNYVFTAETTSTLTINLLSNLAIGRGAQVENDIGFIDSRDENVKILRPMKDISKEELNYYLKFKGLVPAVLKDVRSNSVQTTIGSFVTILQENFQSTISAVCRTADKISAAEDNENQFKKCAICESGLNKTSSRLSALDATVFSRTVSFGKHFHGDSDKDETLFPFIDKHLCYSCSRNFSEMSNGPHLLQNIILSLRNNNDK